MTKLDAGLITSLPASDPGSAAVWGSKRINPRPQFCLCLAWSGCPSNDDDDDLIHSYLQYYIFSWGFASTSTLASSKILHKRAKRIMMFAKRQTPSSPLFYSLHVLKIEDLFKFEIAKFIFKLKNIPDFNYMHNLKPINQIHNYNTRLSKNNYFLQRKKLKPVRNHWNTLDQTFG